MSHAGGARMCLVLADMCEWVDSLDKPYLRACDHMAQGYQTFRHVPAQTSRNEIRPDDMDDALPIAA